MLQMTPQPTFRRPDCFLFLSLPISFAFSFFFVLLLGLLTFTLFPSPCQANFEQSVSDTEMVKHGQEVYSLRCQGCHGEKGNGEGPAAAFLDPRPRDFTKGIFKFTSTPNGSLPTDQDLMKTLNQGVLGTSMPSFAELPEVTRFALVLYIKTFSESWKKPELKKAVLQGDPFPREDFLSHRKFLERAEEGRKIFAENCVVCHGLGGQGDGEGAADLADDWGMTIRPANLTLPFIKSGKSVRDIYGVLLSGVSGTPMPPFKDAIKDQDLWNVAAFVLYLRGEKAGLYDEPSPIPALTQKDLP